MAASVYGLISTDHEANTLVRALQKHGFGVDDISVLFPDQGLSRDFDYQKNSKAPEGATTGVTTGAVLGGALGWMVGIGLLAIPGVGPFIAAGPILAALSGAAIGGAVGGITGTLIGLGIPEFEAKRFEGKIREGRIMVSVRADNAEWVTKAKECFKLVNADDVSSSGEASAHTKSPVGTKLQNATTQISLPKDNRGVR